MSDKDETCPHCVEMEMVIEPPPPGVYEVTKFQEAITNAGELSALRQEVAALREALKESRMFHHCQFDDARKAGEVNDICQACDENADATERLREALGEAEKVVEAARDVFNTKRPGYHDCLDDGLPECEWCLLEKSLARLKSAATVNKTGESE